MVAGEKVSTALAIVRALVAIVGHRKGINTGWGIWTRGPIDPLAVSISDTDEGTIIVELEGIACAETVDNRDDGQPVGLEIKILVDWVVGDLEGEWVEATIGNYLDVIQSTQRNLVAAAATAALAAATRSVSCLFNSGSLLSSGGKDGGEEQKCRG